MAQSAGRHPKPPRPQPTGRYLVLFHTDADLASAGAAIHRATAIPMMSSREFGASATAMTEALSKGTGVLLDRFKVAVFAPAAGVGTRVAALQAIEGVKRVRPEFFLFATQDLRRRYAEWAREGLRLLAEGASVAFETARTTLSEVAQPGTPFADTEEYTWGLAAVGAHQSRFTGRGVRVAVLDTGLDLTHPDVVGRTIVTRNFVTGQGNQDVQDVQGHGTHTTGTIAGPMRSNIGRRYGVAPDVELYVGKVLDDRGSGMEGDILNGMNWAIDQQCAAISMSLGRPTTPDEAPDPLYEQVGSAALAENSLIIAAAGNESARDYNYVAPLDAPASSPSIFAVAAVDPTLQVAPFSCGDLTPDGGKLNISAPGVSVYSSFPQPRLSRVLQGTSMACPHVAGVAALWVESDPTLRGDALRRALMRAARPLGLAADFGQGLVQVPDAGSGTSPTA
jgi:subtilisin family serine protease